MNGIRRKLWPVAAFVLATTLGGCVSTEEVDALRRDVANLRRDMAELNKATESNRTFTDQRLGRVEEEVKGRVEATLKEGEGSRVALNQRLEEMATEARFLQGKQEENAALLRDLQGRVDDASQQGRQANTKVVGLEQQVKSLDQQVKALGQVRSGTSPGLPPAAGQAYGTVVPSPTVGLPAGTAPGTPGMAAPGAPGAAPPVQPAVPGMLSGQPPAAAFPPAAQPPAISAPGTPGMAAPGAPGAAPPAQPPAVAAPTTPGVAAPVVPPVASVPAPRPQPVLPPEELYKTALSDYTKGDYDLAIEGFRSYIQAYPRTSLVPNAQYWLGESYYSQKNYAKAIEEFNIVIQDYPDNPKVPSALFKQGDAYLQMGDAKKGNTVLCELIAKHAKTREARLAKEKNIRCR